MRQLGSLPDAQSGRTLCDYLQSLSIDTRLDQTPEGCVIWVCDEDKVARAREELQAFLASPNDPRFRTTPKPVERPKPEAPPRPRVGNSEAWKLVAERPVTISLIALSILVTVLYYSPPPQEDLVTRYLFITQVTVTGKNDPSGKTTFRWYPGLPELYKGQLWRVLTPMLLHFGPWHLVFNMYWLYLLGGQIEKRSGSLRLGFLVVMIATISNLCQYRYSDVRLGDNWLPEIVQSNPAFGGMSGVVFGLFGYVWLRVLYDRNCGLTITVGSVFLMIVWLYVCMTGLVGPIANTAHLSGLFVGMVAGYAASWWQGFGQREGAS